MTMWWGWLTVYDTGETIREATEEDWKRSRDKMHSGDPDAYTGAWKDDEGRVVYVDGGPHMEVPVRRISGQLPT